MCRIPPTHVEPARSRVRLVIALLGTGLLAGACADKPAPPPPPPPEVLVTPVVRRDVPVPMELVGQTRGFQDVEIRARVEGFLDVVGFQEGTLVRRGEVLYRIDRKPLEASLATAKAELGTAQARYEKTQNDVKRLQPLAAKQAVSAQELDDAVAAADAARSQVEARKAEVDQRVARSRLHERHLADRRPRSARRWSRPAAWSAAARARCSRRSRRSTRSSSAPASARRSTCASRGGPRNSREANGGKIPIDLMLADGTVHPHKGYLDAIERAIDPTTGTLEPAVQVPEPGRLAPSRPVRPRRSSSWSPRRTRCSCRSAPCRRCRTCTASPWSAATTRSRSRTSRSARASTSLWVIESGLTGNEKVVVAGLQRLREGTVVTPKPAPPSHRRRRGHAAPAATRRSGGALGHGQVLRQPADRGDGAVHHHGHAGPRGDAGPADRAVPRDRAADGADHHDVRRRQRHRRRGRRRDAARAEDQRRREGHLHEVHQRQRRHVDVEGLVRGRQQPRHGQRPHAEPRVGSDAAAAAGGEELRRGGEEGARRSRCWSSR